MKQRKLAALIAVPALCVAVSATTVVADSREGSLSAHMHEHWQRIGEIQAALIRGDLAAIREPAGYLAEHPEPASLPPQWQNHLAAMRQAARAAANADDFATAANATALMGAACGDCHTDAGVDVEFEATDPPGYDTDTTSHMLRHQWAADRMWQGIVAPSEPAWASGIDALLEAPLTPHELKGGGEEPDRVKKMARRIHQLAGNGMMAGTQAEKAAIYGEFLANCADCHTTLR